MVSLTTDFGWGSPYVAAMKAAVLEACPGAVLVDVSHDVPAFDVVAGAFVLWAGSRHFQPGSVHLAVVDPGVGSDRRRVAVRAGKRFYVGPDNGIFTLVLAESPLQSAVELSAPAGASRTFEGRDVLAPVAGALAAGVALGRLGRPLPDLVRLPLPESRVLWVDGFGNLVLSLREAEGVRINGWEIRERAATYGEAPAGRPFLYRGSMDFLEVGLRQGRADQLLGAAAGTPVEVL
ncbi:MAG TPA: SAM-dependent chlorinase/fluorinase [Candidatus Acidoferrales bacterium]|nr:SAM-dependent chlorinase/fluorinase [Candidatus Acidoferrales bacterium]